MLMAAHTVFAIIGCLLVILGFIGVFICVLINHCNDHFVFPSTSQSRPPQQSPFTDTPLYHPAPVFAE